MKYNKETIKTILKHIEGGNTVKDAVVLGGISRKTYYEWLKEKPGFKKRAKKSQKKCLAKNIAIIQAAGKKSWQASAWWLERTEKDRFALRREVAGVKKKPIKFEISELSDKEVTQKREELLRYFTTDTQEPPTH